MDFKKIANFFCDLMYQYSKDKDIMTLVKIMISTKNFSFAEINWCFPLCTKEKYYKTMYDIIAQFRKEGYSDGDIIQILDISEEDFEEACKEEDK